MTERDSDLFRRWLVQQTPDDKGNQRGYCPLHEDPELSGTPSAGFNFSKGLFNCFVCGGMKIATLKGMMDEDDFKDASPAPSSQAGGQDAPVFDLTSKREQKSRERKGEREPDPLPDEETVLGWHRTLMGNPTVLDRLHERRGLTNETLERFLVGYNTRDGRYTIPIRAEDGTTLLNVRRYKLGGEPGNKMIGITGHNDTNVFPRQVLADNETVVLCEGEMDALIGNQYGFPTVTATGGAKRMPEHIAKMFTGKRVFICYDADDTGKAGAIKAGLTIRKYAAEVFILRLPLTGKEDLTDYFVNHSHSAEEFQDLLDSAVLDPFVDKARASRAEKKAEAVSLESSQSADHGSKPLEITVSVAGKVQPAYVLPRTTTFTCDQDWGSKCAKCNMSLLYNGNTSKDIAKDDALLLELIDVPKDKKQKLLASELAGAPPTCPRLQIDEDAHWNAEELLVMPSVENRDEQAQTPITRRVYNVGEYGTPVNEVSRLIGANTPDPRTGRAVFQAWESEQVKTNLDKFEMTDDIYEDLQVFWPSQGQTPLQKLKHIATDIEANVTRIYGRPEMHIAYDLVWHSVMDFKFRDVLLGKGWLELLVMGDTRTGKSEAALRLCEHYNAGILKSCEGATLAGLVGGAQQTGNNWMVAWGTIPLNDRRLVVLDEASGLADKNIIEQMSAVRSMGKAQVNKIITQETSARTRLVWISNPPDGRPIKEMGRGAIEAMQQLIRNPEDIARFDLAISAASSDVDSSVINTLEPPTAPHTYTRPLASTLVAWVWSRKAEDVTWAPGAEERVMVLAEELGASYVAEPPLIQAENVRVKLARIAAAVAGRLFSCDDTGEKLVIKVEHVDTARVLLDRLYGMPSMGYREFSARTLRAREQAQANKEECRGYLVSHEAALDTLQNVDQDFRPRDFEEFGNMMRDEAQLTVKELMKMRMLRRMSKGYIRKEPALLEVLRGFQDYVD